MFIHNLRLHRNLKLYQQIYNFNRLTSIISDDSWLNNFEAESSLIKQTDTLLKRHMISNFYYEKNDIWLKLISLPKKHFNHLLQQTILFLISYDKSLPLDSKKRLLLQNIFKIESLEKIYLKNDNTVEINVPKLNNQLLNSNDFILNSGFEILKSIYNTKHSAMSERIKFRFEKNLQPDSNIIEYWQQVTKENKETAMIFVAKKYFVNLFLN